MFAGAGGDERWAQEYLQAEARQAEIQGQVNVDSASSESRLEVFSLLCSDCDSDRPGRAANVRLLHAARSSAGINSAPTSRALFRFVVDSRIYLFDS